MFNEYDDYNPDNELFLRIAKANERATPSRQKGYYICPAKDGCATEFLKAVAKPKQPCPFCGRLCDRVLVMSPAEVLEVEMRWEEDGIWSPIKADRIQKGA